MNSMKSVAARRRVGNIDIIVARAQMHHLSAGRRVIPGTYIHVEEYKRLPNWPGI